MLSWSNVMCATSADSYRTTSVLANGVWGKISVMESGIHALTAETARRAGLKDLSKVKVYGYGGALVPERLTEQWIREHDDLQEIPTCMKDGVKYFYAQGPVSWEDSLSLTRIRNPYSDYGYYFITQSADGEPLTCTEDSLLGIARRGAENYHYLYEKDEFAWDELGRELVEKIPIQAGTSRTINLFVPKNAKMVDIVGVVSCGGASTYTASSADYDSHSFSINSFTTYKHADFRSFESYLDSKVLDTLEISSTTGRRVIPITIKCISGGPVRIDHVLASFDVPDELPSLNTTDYPSAQYVYNIMPQNHHADETVDMVIIIPTSQKWLAEAETLVDLHREKDGMTVRIVPADELYNEFSSGTPDVSAYKRYLKMFHDRTNGNGVKYVLLFGDCLWDNRMKTVTGYNVDDYLLGYQTYDSEYTTSSLMADDFITVMDDGQTIHVDGYRDINLRLKVATGRLPVSTVAQAENVVKKIVSYTKNVGAWQNEIMFMADDGNKSTSNNNIHMININENADSVRSQNPGYDVKKVLFDAYEKTSSATGDAFPDVVNITHGQQNNGALVMNYGGHASWSELSEEKVFKLSDFSEFKGDNYSLWFTAACETMPLDLTHSSLGEDALLNPNGGAIGFVGTIRTVYEMDNARLNIRFMRNVLSYEDSIKGTPVAIGEALRLAKNELIASRLDFSQNKHNYTLAGDPALRLALPRYAVKIEKFNGRSIEQIDTVKGNSIVTMSGCITDLKGNKIDDFNGKATVVIRDSKEDVTCRGQNNEDPLTYDDYTSVLYKGTCSVVKGEFECMFRVPRGLHNDGGPGLATVFAIDETDVDNILTAHGESKALVMRGYKEVENDSIGPTIYSYLNSPTFRNGDAVGQTPFFVAEVSDNDGLDVTGNNVGHNLELVVDGDATMTYDLNDNFQYEDGSYTNGQTYYVLPELPAGYHSLYFRAWDLLGNYSVVSLRFRVAKGIAPEIKDIFVSPNPVRGSATFYVTHDLQGSNATVYIDIIDLTGRIVETLEWNDYLSTSSNTTSYHWTPSGVSRGMYLYRVRITCDGNNYNSKTRKLIIAQ